MFYSHLSDKKRQDTGTVAENIWVMLYNLFQTKELQIGQLKVLISIETGVRCSIGVDQYAMNIAILLWSLG